MKEAWFKANNIRRCNWKMPKETDSTSDPEARLETFALQAKVQSETDFAVKKSHKYLVSESCSGAGKTSCVFDINQPRESCILEGGGSVSGPSFAVPPTGSHTEIS